MKVKELKALLNSLPDDLLIVMSSDGEGNDFSPLSGHSIGKYMVETSWCGSFMSDLDFADEVREGYVEEDEGQAALCLWPIN